MKTITKVLEYPDAPSGAVRLYNYKEPFMEFQGGYGYKGVLLFDAENDTVQCHLCGQWFGALAPHLSKEHNITVKDYKDMVGLLQTTALISESMRAKLIATGMKSRLKNLRAGTKKTEEQKKKISQTLRENSNKSEFQNLRGTCPLQLIESLIKKYNELGRTPTTKEIGNGRVQTIERVHGSLKNACFLAGIPYRASGKTVTDRTKYNKDYCIKFSKDFYQENKRLPRCIDCPTDRVWSAIKKYGKKEVFKLALHSDGNYFRPPEPFHYTQEELLGFLKRFKEINNRKPSASDCRRGLLPHASRFSYRFGSWKRSLEIAFS